MTITAVIIPADPSIPCERRQLDPHDLKEYQKIVGGNIDALELVQPPAAFYLNDEGKINGLMPNQRATLLLWVHNPVFRGQDILAGDVFLVGPTDGEGHDTDAPEALVKLLFDTERFKVEERRNSEDGWQSNGMVFDDVFGAYTWAVQFAHRVQDVRVAAADE